VSSSDIHWYHCGRCGTLFQSDLGESESRLCPKCGFDPSPGVQGQIPEAVTPAATSEAAQDPSSEKSSRQKVRRRKNQHLMVKIFMGWLLLLSAIFFAVRHHYHDENAERIAAKEVDRSPEAAPDPDAEFMNKHLQACGNTFVSFLAESAPEQCSEYVLTPLDTISRMVRFQGYNSLPKLDPESLTPSANSVLHFNEGKGIEIRWNTKDGRQIETAFREVQGEWKLDWEHYSRYSDYSWSLFLAGSGPDEGEFRLLARERLVEERKDKDTTVSVVFYTPRFGQPEETGIQSAEFLIARDSESGKMLQAGFAAAAAGKHPFGCKLPNPNPDGLIRVRVKVKRIEANGERRFEVVSVPACHWYSTDEPGIELTPTPAENPGAGH
jgi:hypothetical protein